VPLVLDASVTLDFCLKSEGSEYAHSRFTHAYETSNQALPERPE